MIIKDLPIKKYKFYLKNYFKFLEILLSGREILVILLISHHKLFQILCFSTVWDYHEGWADQTRKTKTSGKYPELSECLFLCVAPIVGITSDLNKCRGKKESWYWNREIQVLKLDFFFPMGTIYITLYH